MATKSCRVWRPSTLQYVTTHNHTEQHDTTHYRKCQNPFSKILTGTIANTTQLDVTLHSRTEIGTCFHIPNARILFREFWPMRNDTTDHSTVRNVSTLYSLVKRQSFLSKTLTRARRDGTIAHMTRHYVTRHHITSKN